MSTQVRIELIGDASQAQKAVRAFTGESEKSAKRIGDVFAGVQISQYVDRARQAIGNFARESIDSFQEAEVAQTRLDDAYSKFPQLAGKNADELRKLNVQLMAKTKFDDDAYASGQAVLAQFKLSHEQLKSVTPVLADYAAKTGKDLPTAAKALGRAFMGNTRALKEVGINYKSTGDQAKDTANITALLRQQVGGFAEKEGKTAAGQAAILDNQLGELQEGIGKELLPAQIKMRQAQAQLVGVFSKFPGPVQAGILAVGGLATTIGPVIPLLAHSKGALSALGRGVKTFGMTLLTPPLGIVVAIAALVAGLVLAYQKVGWFRRAVDTAIRGVKIAAGWLINAGAGVLSWFRKNWPLILAVLTGPIGIAVYTIKRNWNSIVDFVTGLPGRISRGAAGMWDGIWQGFKGTLNDLIRAWNGLEFKVPGWDPPGPIGKIGGFTLGMPDIPLLHAGGHVDAGGLVNWKPGEEVAYMPSGATVKPLGAGAGGALVGQIGPFVGVSRRDADYIVKVVREELRKIIRRNGTSGV